MAQVNRKSSAATDSLVGEVSRLINQRTGIQLGAKQMAMVESRLHRRLRDLGLNSFEEYRVHFDTHRGAEVEALVSLLTTHHTFFFREFPQFEFLEQQLGGLVARARARGSKVLEVYSAACSRGQEVYSLAMHLSRHLKAVAPDFDFKIYGSDVDHESVAVASNGVYQRDELKNVPLPYLEDHWVRGTGEISEFVKARQSLRSHCDFGVVNLIDLKGVEGRKFDVIFCRNVYIYFTPEQIKTISRGLFSKLHPGGLFFVGVSESLHSLGLPLEVVGPSVYTTVEPSPVKAPAAPAPAAIRPVKPAPAPTPISSVPNPLRVVCVDDSPSILTLLKKILGKEHGFEVVAVATNGKEAEEVIQREKPHLVTLDIHMPVRTGLEFLEGTRGKPRPPVVMVTSVSRDDAALAWKALSLGAADYVEKPALNNLEQRAEEIRAKLRSAFRTKEMASSHSLDKQFSHAAKIANPAACAGLFVFGLADMDRCAKVLREVAPLGVPVFLAVEGADAILPSLAERLGQETGLKVEAGIPAAATGNTICVGGLKEAVKGASAKSSVSVLVFGEISKHGAKELHALSKPQFLLEDLGGGKGTTPLRGAAADVVPASSFAYLAQAFWAGEKKGKT